MRDLPNMTIGSTTKKAFDLKCRKYMTLNFFAHVILKIETSNTWEQI